MTTHADFTDEEWKTVLEGPTSAGMIVTTAERGGSFRESFAMAKAFAEARQEHGASELLDEVVNHRPKTERVKAHSKEELKDAYLQEIRDAVALVSAKATTEELGDYRQFVVTLAKKVAAAKEEKGSEDGVSPAEAEAITAIEGALGAA
jgi:predicted house-cleaning noncanonical NTP pyrophosphatase (MazG superfamily)